MDDPWLYGKDSRPLGQHCGRGWQVHYSLPGLNQSLATLIGENKGYVYMRVTKAEYN